MKYMRIQTFFFFFFSLSSLVLLTSYSLVYNLFLFLFFSGEGRAWCTLAGFQDFLMSRAHEVYYSTCHG